MIKNKQGYTLVEMLVAIAVLSIALIPMSGLMKSANSSTLPPLYDYYATQLLKNELYKIALQVDGLKTPDRIIKDLNGKSYQVKLATIESSSSEVFCYTGTISAYLQERMRTLSFCYPNQTKDTP